MSLGGWPGFCFIRRMCPAHRSLVARTASIMQNVFVSARASSRMGFPVMMLSIWLLAPFSTLRTSSFSFHASAPYIIIEHMHAAYKRSFKFRWTALLFHTCRICPCLFLAMATRRRTSVICWSPPASKIDPRCLPNVHKRNNGQNNLQQILHLHQNTCF